MSIWDKILQTYKGHMGLVKHYLFGIFHELLFLLLIINYPYRICDMDKLYRMCVISHMCYGLFISHMRYIAYAIHRITFRAYLCGMASIFTMSLATSKLYGWWDPTIDYFMEVL